MDDDNHEIASLGLTLGIAAYYQVSRSKRFHGELDLWMHELLHKCVGPFKYEYRQWHSDVTLDAAGNVGYRVPSFEEVQHITQTAYEIQNSLFHVAAVSIPMEGEEEIFARILNLSGVVESNFSFVDVSEIAARPELMNLIAEYELFTASSLVMMLGSLAVRHYRFGGEDNRIEAVIDRTQRQSGDEFVSAFQFANLPESWFSEHSELSGVVDMYSDSIYEFVSDQELKTWAMLLILPKLTSHWTGHPHLPSVADYIRRSGLSVHLPAVLSRMCEDRLRWEPWVSPRTMRMYENHYLPISDADLTPWDS